VKNSRIRRRVSYLRDVDTICPAVSKLSSGLILNRCEPDVGHEGRHKDGPALWSGPHGAQPDAVEVFDTVDGLNDING
jgi:hypothetical protein